MTLYITKHREIYSSFILRFFSFFHNFKFSIKISLFFFWTKEYWTESFRTLYMMINDLSEKKQNKKFRCKFDTCIPSSDFDQTCFQASVKIYMDMSVLNRSLFR